jgi:hypothetical protein
MLCCQRSLAITRYGSTTSDHPLKPPRRPFPIPNPHLTRPPNINLPFLASAHLSLANHYQTSSALPPLISHQNLNLETPTPKIQPKHRPPTTGLSQPSSAAPCYCTPIHSSRRHTRLRADRYKSRLFIPLTRARSRRTIRAVPHLGPALADRDGIFAWTSGSRMLGGRWGGTNQKYDFIYFTS